MKKIAAGLKVCVYVPPIFEELANAADMQIKSSVEAKIKNIFAHHAQQFLKASFLILKLGLKIQVTAINIYLSSLSFIIYLS